MPGFSHQIENFTLTKPWGIVPVGFGDNLHSTKRIGSSYRPLEIGYSASVILEKEGTKINSDTLLQNVPGIDVILESDHPHAQTLKTIADQVMLHLSFAFGKDLCRSARPPIAKIRPTIDFPSDRIPGALARSFLRNIFLFKDLKCKVELGNIRYAVRGHRGREDPSPPIFGNSMPFAEERVIPVLNGAGEIVNLLFLYRERENGPVTKTDLISQFSDLHLGAPAPEVREAARILGGIEEADEQAKALKDTRINGWTLLAAAECLAAQIAFRAHLDIDEEKTIYSNQLDYLVEARGKMDWSRDSVGNRHKTISAREKAVVELYV